MKTKKKTEVTGAKVLENRKAAEKALRDKAWRRITASKIPDLVKAAMLMANSLNLLTVQIDRMVRADEEGLVAAMAGY